MTLPTRRAVAADIPAVHDLIERGFRGDATQTGWTHESDLFDGARTDAETLAAIIGHPQSRLLVAERDGAIVASVQVTDCGDGLAYLGMLCVDGALQAGGIGRAMIAIAEDMAQSDFAARRMEMTVIDQRPELIEYYRRRGYTPTGEARALQAAAGITRVPVVLLVLARNFTGAA